MRWRFCVNVIFSTPRFVHFRRRPGCMEQKTQFEAAMNRAFELAAQSPAFGVNPQVGAVILDASGQIVAEGYHRGAGTAHAEVDALANLKAAGISAAGLTAVVTLEPCNHTGKTGPCSQALIAAGIGRVVFAASDPGEKSKGGAQTLADAGIEVLAGVQAVRGFDLIKPWVVNTFLKRPYVLLKWASSIDGRSAAPDGSSKWITGPEARADVHLRRSKADAILVGTGTVLADDPELTARQEDGSLYADQPLRVVVGESKLEATARVFNRDAKTVHFETRDMNLVLSELFSRGIRSLFIEGGPTVATQFVNLGLVDEYLVYLAPMLIGGPKTSIKQLDVATMSEAQQLEFIQVEKLGKDLFIHALPREK